MSYAYQVIQDVSSKKSNKIILAILGSITLLSAVFTIKDGFETQAENIAKATADSIEVTVRSRIAKGVDTIQMVSKASQDSLIQLIDRADSAQQIAERNLQILNSTYATVLQNLNQTSEVNIKLIRKFSVDYSMLYQYFPLGFTVVIFLEDGSYEQVRYPGREYISINRLTYQYGNDSEEYIFTLNFDWFDGPPDSTSIKNSGGRGILPGGRVYNYGNSGFDVPGGTILLMLIEDIPSAPTFAVGKVNTRRRE